MWDEQTIEQITVEMRLIDQLFTIYADLLSEMQQRAPGLVEKTALASVLHSFYNGVETICLTVAKRIDQDVPTGSRWHRDLLRRMGQATATRPPVFSESTIERLGYYLSFRHFYRHAYSFLVEWEKLEHLIGSMDAVWTQTRMELELFLGASGTDVGNEEL